MQVYGCGVVATTGVKGGGRVGLVGALGLKTWLTCPHVAQVLCWYVCDAPWLYGEERRHLGWRCAGGGRGGWWWMVESERQSKGFSPDV